MTHTPLDSSIVPPCLEDAAFELAIALTLALGSASLVALSLGDPELTALVAVTGLAVTLLALALLSADAFGDRARAPGTVSRLRGRHLPRP